MSKPISFKDSRTELNKIYTQIRDKERELAELEDEKTTLMVINTVLYKQQTAWDGKDWDSSQIGNWRYYENPKPCLHCKKTMSNEQAQYLKSCTECDYPNANYGNISLSKRICSVCSATDQWKYHTEGLCPSMTYGTCEHCGNHVFISGG
jgi:hypothetical protein